VVEEDVADGRPCAPSGDAILDEVKESEMVSQKSVNVQKHQIDFLFA